ncbi:MAG: hypothetical protein AXA67_08335 [Methylothermaceae bacteria B42]|nr:MAG: hypothetical protein AXA67_08335 [Methylothermaceae bacteria B42]HHJ40458.1 1-acyl-sn-glycerol-3-phosphate acyltransferase [Methylothermaceae bacterium]
MLSKYWNPLQKKLRWIIRFGVTVISYSVYGLGSFLLWYGIYPLTSWWIKPSERPAHARHLSYLAFNFFVRFLNFIGYWRYQVIGADKLRKPGRVIVANHPSFLDIVLLFSLVDNAVCVVKPSLARVPLVSAPIRRCRHITAETPQRLIADAVIALRNGASLILFPQGTRTPPDLPVHFQRSAARIALEAKVPIVPVFFCYQPLLLGKGQWWYNLPDKTPTVLAVVGEELNPKRLIDPALQLSIASRRLTQMLESRLSELDKRYGFSGK